MMDGNGSVEHLIFVYGTLKSNEPNHHIIMGPDGSGIPGVRRVGSGVTKDRFPLIIATDYNIPFLLLHDRKTGNNIKGEVYAVNDAVFAKLDELEFYPDLYDRQQIGISMTSDESHQEDRTLQCWLYGLPRFKPSILQTHTTYDDYHSNGEHNRPYIFLAPDSTIEGFNEELFGSQS